MPLVEMVLRTEDPPATCQHLLDTARTREAGRLVAFAPDNALGHVALRYAGILTSSGEITPEAGELLVRLDTIVAMRLQSTERWSPVATIPAYLRSARPAGSIQETLNVLRDLVSGAETRIIMAAPFIDSGLDNLIPPLAHFVRERGSLLVVTRALTDPGSRNADAVRALRDACGRSSRLEVVSWEEERLGLHMKTLVVDSREAYVGSANLTWSGLEDHAELGVFLEGPAVREIEVLLDELAQVLRQRRRLRSR